MKKLEIITLILIVFCLSAFAGIGTVSVGQTPVTVVLGNDGYMAKNRWFILQNNSTNDIFVKMDSSTNALTTNNGIKVFANGGSLSVTSTLANPAANDIKAVSATGTNTLNVQWGKDSLQ